VKIAISVAVGPLHKWGYQWVCRECLASQAEFADHVYMVQSTEDATGAQELLDEFSNITLISNLSTWHHKPGESDEILMGGRSMGAFTTFHMRNLAFGRMAAFDDGYRIVLSTHNNWYIPRRNVASLRQHCEAFERSGKTTGHSWMMPQLHDRLLGPANRNEGLCNLSGMRNGNKIRAYYPEMKWRHLPVKEIPANVGEICVVDCSYNLLPSEYEGMQRRFGYPGNDSFDWETRRAQLADRLLRRNVVVKVPLDYWGEKIAAKSGPDFMGYQILKEAKLL
jgi:hypothetical protein